MRGRALSLAALAFLVGLSGAIAAGPDVAQAQQLDAGKPPSQIFASTCSVCHRSPRGLVKNVSPGALPGFLRQHYTTGSDMAGIMAAYVLGSGGTDRVAEPPPAAKREPKQRAKNDGDVATRNPDARELSKDQPKAAKQKAAKKGPADAAKQEAAKGPADAAKDDIAKQPEPMKPEPEKVETAKPAPPATETPKSEAAGAETVKETAPETKPAAVATPAQPPAAPRQPTSLLTLPGFPPPVAEPEPTPTATTPASSEPAKPSTPASPAAEAPAPAPAPVAEAPKAEPAKIEPVKPAEAAPSDEPNTDIMREEVHAPTPARSGQKKRAPQAPQ